MARKIDLKKHPHVNSYGDIIYKFIKKYPGATLEQICQLPDDEGIKYLDWLIGQDWLHANTRGEIEAYLEAKHKAAWDAIGAEEDDD